MELTRQDTVDSTNMMAVQEQHDKGYSAREGSRELRVTSTQAGQHLHHHSLTVPEQGKVVTAHWQSQTS